MKNKFTVFCSDSVFGMANLVPKKTGLSADIWSEHKGVSRNVSHKNSPRLKITKGNYTVSVTISDNPQIKAESRRGSQSEKSAIKEAMKYVARNYDIFLKHYMDPDDSFDDEDLFNALRERGEYK